MKFNSKSLAGSLCAVAAIGLVAVATPDFASAQQAAANESLDDVAMRFGVRSSVLDITLSPSGNKIAWVAPGPNHSEVVNVFDLEGTGGISTIISNTEIIADMTGCEWATDERLVCEIYGMGRRSDGVLLPFTRMFAINDDGSDADQLTENRSIRALGFNQDGGEIVALDVPGQNERILMTRNWQAEDGTGTRLANQKVGLGVDSIDVRTGRRRIEEQPDERASFYLADENGDLRLKARDLIDGRGYLTGERVYMVRDAGESRWERLEGITLGGRPLEGFRPVAVDASRNSIFSYVSINGYRAVVEIPLDGSGEARILARRDDVDVDGLIRIGRQRRVVGVSYATEKRSVEYFDDDLNSLANGLAQALPNQPLVSIVGADAAENRILLIASSDTDPGMVYLYDKGTRQLEELLPMRDLLVGQRLGAMQPVEYPAADGTIIPGYLTLPPGSDGQNLPAIVLPHGGPAARDYWGFDWIVQFFTARGYAVLQPNYRGSSGYGEAWFGRNGYQAWDVAIGDVNDAGRWLVSQGIADPDRMAIVGWSYGGYAALQSQVMDPELFKAVVAIAPVTDLEFLRRDARQYTSFRYRDRQLGEGPHIAAGSPRRHADQFLAPVALFHGTRDLNVSVSHSRAMEDALQDAGKQVRYVEFEDLQHGLRDSRARYEMLREIDDFLESALGD